MTAYSVDTSTYSQSVNARSISVDSTGRIWTMHWSLADTRFEFWYSDNGSTFTEATSLRTSPGTAKIGRASCRERVLC